MRKRILPGLAAMLVAFQAHADYSDTVLSFNPVGYWRLNETNVPAADMATNLGSLGDAGGGYYMTGSTHPVAGALVGRTNTAAGFDGISGEVRVPFTPALSLEPPFTVEAWVQPRQVPPAYDPAAVLACLDFAGSGRLGWIIYQSGANWDLRLGDTNGYTSEALGSMVIQADEWYHLAAVYDGTNATLFVNGTVDATAPVDSYTPNDSAPLEIGGAAAIAGGRFNSAFMDEVALYTNALTAAEILQHYENGTNPAPSLSYEELVLTNNPLIYFRLDEPAVLLPVATNQGSLGENADGRYLPGLLPGVAGVPYSGLGAANLSCEFNGERGAIDLVADAGLNVHGPLTLITWMKANPSADRRQCLAGRGDTSWRMGLNQQGQPVFAVGQANFQVTGTTGVDDGKWHQLAGVFDGGTFQLYVDGSSNAVVTAPYPIEGNTNAATIGRAPDYADRFFSGWIDEVALFTNALAAGDIQQIYESAEVPPRILVAPDSQTVNEGASLTLSVAAIGTPPLSFQWDRDGTNLPGQTAPVLALDQVGPSDSGNYLVEVSNRYGAVSSAAATVTVLPGPPIIYRQPQGLARYVGESAALTIEAGGTAPLAYQWNFNWSPVPGATNRTYEIASLQLTNAGYYHCTITNLYGSTNSDDVLLAVVAAPADPYATAVLEDNPSAYWRLGERYGSTAYDFAGGHDGLYTNVALGQPGYSWFDLDAAAAFGPDNNSCVADIDGIDFATSNSTAAFSVEAWVKCPPGQKPGAGLVSKGAAIGSEQFSLEVGEDGNYQFLVRDSSGGAAVADSGVPPDNHWQHLVGVCDEPQGFLHLYVDGVEQSIVGMSNGVNSASAPVAIGSRQSAGAGYDLNLNGVIDEAALYDYALSAAQVLAHFHARYPTNASPLIARQPESQTNYAAFPATFAVEAAGTPPLAYQWQFNGESIPGASNSTLTLPALDATNAGFYSVAVGNPVGTNYSNAAQLTVLPVPTALDVSSDLALHLKFDGDYLDYSGQANHGLEVGATALVPGTIGSGALSCSSDASSESYNYVTLGLRPSLQFGSNADFSVAYWVRLPPGATPGGLPLLGNAIRSAPNPGYDFALGADPVSGAGTGGWIWTLRDSDGNSVYALGATNSINDGRWHQLVHTFDRSGEAVTYLDGISVDSRPIGHLDGSSIGDLDTGQPTNIGQDPTGLYGVTASADLDDIGVWRRVLTPFEVASLYAAGRSNGVSFATVPLPIAIQQSNDDLELTWPAGILQTADQVVGPYEDILNATPPHQLHPSKDQKYYRLRQ